MDHYYSRRNQLAEVKKILKTNNLVWDKKIIDTSKSGTNYFSRVLSKVPKIIMNPVDPRVTLLQTLDLCTMLSRMPPTTSSMLRPSSSHSTMATGKLLSSM